ncbi:hypothetical protein EDC18_10346 [Natranaerovirga pectinivora]|uniref:Uncharacterized protein n=1 Tax=Natranaerovirga pectinivora TaxID=682400 RepID=A0A4R3MKZ9_9FIRM|nr:hypothetical protein [Natranaerovirga pectinivora]TCT15342.1 hypothetical protein EDC18_10346 [Natranaerovirga pectinivora]
MSSNILNNEAFRNIDPRKLQVLVEMFNEMGSKPTDQKIQVLFSYGMKMKQMGLQFTTNETNLIMNSLKEGLSPAERNKIDMMINMMSMLNQQN